MQVLEATFFERFGKAALASEAKWVGTIGGEERASNVTVHSSEAGRKIGLIVRSPDYKTGACIGFDHAVNLAQCAIDVGKEHDTEAGSRQIKLVGGERKLLSIALPRRDVGEAALARAVGGDGQ